MSTAGSFIIVTGGDALYFPLITELIGSVHAACPAGAGSPAIGVIDGGLTGPQRAELIAKYGCLVADFAAADDAEKRALRARPALAVNLGKLHLDQMFPGFEKIIFMDADSWVQDWRAIEYLLGASSGGALAITPSWNRYRDHAVAVRWWLWRFPQLRSFNIKNARHAGLPHRVRREVGVKVDLNAGVFALNAAAKHWERMRHWQRLILRKGKPFTSDGLAMALTCHIDNYPLQQLPAFCNYMEKWLYNPTSGKFVDYFYPHEPVGIVHLADQKVLRFDRTATIAVAGTDGLTHQISLRFAGKANEPINAESGVVLATEEAGR
jgi:hypothetical protein